MTRHEATTIVDRDEEGRITSIVVRWGETRPAVDQLLVVVASAGMIYGVCAVLLGLLVMHGGLIASGVLLMALLGCIWLQPTITRSLSFHADGSIGVANGIPYRSRPGRLRIEHSQIQSIEPRPDRGRNEKRVHQNLYEIVILSGEGDLITISHNLFEWTAIQAVTQLNAARLELQRDTLERKRQKPKPVTDDPELHELLVALVNHHYPVPAKSSPTSAQPALFPRRQ